MSHEESNHSEQLLLFPTKDFITLREIADCGMLVFGDVGSGKTSTASAQFARVMEQSASFGGLVMTHKVPSADEEA
jgi:hypothetical protein